MSPCLLISGSSHKPPFTVHIVGMQLASDSVQMVARLVQQGYPGVYVGACLQVTTLKSLNDALNCLDISVRPSNPKFPSDPAGHWNVLDGRALLRYREGLVSTLCLPSKSRLNDSCMHTVAVVLYLLSYDALPHYLAAPEDATAAIERVSYVLSMYTAAHR